MQKAENVVFVVFETHETVFISEEVVMSLIRLFACGAAVLSLVVFAAGCNNDVPNDNLEPLPPAMDDPSGSGLGKGLTPGDEWGKNGEFKPGADDASLGKAAGDWSAVDPGNNLGFPIVYFGFDTDELAPGETAKLDRVNAYLGEHQQLLLIIEGHCDQRGTEEYNRALGERRANAIRAYLTGNGLADSRIKTISYGEDRPAVEGGNEAAWSKNRRGVLVPAKAN